MSKTEKSTLVELVSSTLNLEKRYITVEDVEYFLEEAESENPLIKDLQAYWKLVVTNHKLQSELNRTKQQ